MHIVLATERRAHYLHFVNTQLGLGNTVGVYTTTPQSMLKGFPRNIDYHFVPGPITLLRGLLRNKFNPPRIMNDWDCCFFDELTAMVLQSCDMILGAASSSLATGKAAKRKGGKYILDRACPDIRYQESMISEEAKKAGGVFIKAPDWFLDRQVQEYEEANFIIAPSNYSGSSYPQHLRDKVVIAPISGRSSGIPSAKKKSNRPFTVGVVGGNPLRKGYLYLLQAWKELGWNDAQLLLRTSKEECKVYSVISQLLESQANITLVDYVPNLSDFYEQCDVFVLPSVDDGFGMVLSEAMEHGIPSIATSHCGASELFTSEDEILLIEPFSVEALKSSLQRLRDSPDLREKLAANGREKILKLKQSSDAAYKKGIAELMGRAFQTA